MAAEHDYHRLHIHHHRPERRQSPSRTERHRDMDRAFHRSDSRRERNPDSRLIHQDSRTQARTFDADDDHGFLESATRRHSESQPAPASNPPAHGDPIDSYQNVQVPNQSKVYIGGLPELTRLEDLNDCFSQLGRIKNIEQKSGYAFVEYDNPQSACDAVAKYHEGTFLGSQIKVEISHGGSRPRHVAVSNNPEACYTCGVAGHWARDCPDADSQTYHKRRPRPRSRTPPRGREDAYIHRDSRHQVEVASYDHPRRQSPLAQIDYIRADGHERSAPPPRERYPLPDYAEGKRYRPVQSFLDRERDYQRLDLKVSSRQDHRDPPNTLPSFSRTSPLTVRDNDYTERTRRVDPYLSRSLPRTRDSQNDWAHEIKSDVPKSAYHRDLIRTYEPNRLGGYNDRSYIDQRLSYPTERMTGSNLIDIRYSIPDTRFPRGDSPRRSRSPRRSLSPARRTSNNYRSSYRAQSPPGSRSGHDFGPIGYNRATYSMRR